MAKKFQLHGNFNLSGYDERYYFNSLALAKAAAATAKEVGSTDTVYYYGMKLLVDDGVYDKWYIIQRDGTLVEEQTGSGSGGTSFTTDETLVLEDGTLRVNTTDAASADSKLPITSAGVYAQLGNISDLLTDI